MIVFRNITKKEALNIAERLRVQVEKFVYREEKLNIKFTISIGVAKFKNGIEYTIDISDEALYSAKSLGRNRVVYKEV